MSETRRGRKPHTVYQYDLGGNLIAIYSSITEAGQKTFLSSSNICAVIKGKRKTCGGFIWRDQSE